MFIEIKYNLWTQENTKPGEIAAYVGPFYDFGSARHEQAIIVSFNSGDFSARVVSETGPVTKLPHGVEKSCPNCPHDTKPGTVYLHPVFGNPYHYC